jgi:hypothetical protein
MSDEKEELEYKIEKLHRKKVQGKLDEIKKELSESRVNQQKIATKRRRENIYVLFSLAIIGGFLSITSRNSIVLDPVFIRTFAFFTVISLVFIIIKINTVALSNVSYIEDNEKSLDDYIDYLFTFSINGVFILITFATAVDSFNIGISQVESIGLLIGTAIISAVISLIFGYFRHRQKQLYNLSAEMGKNREEIKEELTEDIISEIENLKNTDDMQEEINEFKDLAIYIEQSGREFTEPEDFDPIFEELDNLDLISDELEESIRQSFTEKRENIRDKVMQEANMDERIERIEEEYEKMAFNGE